MHQGYIKVYRQLQDWWLWNDPEPFDKRAAWIDMLLMTNHADKKILFEGNVKTIQKGQFLTSIMKLSQKWKWERKKTTRFLDLLENDGMVTTERTPHGTIITIVNWDKYQCDGATDGTTNRTSKGQHKGQQKDNTWDTNKNDKECIKNEKNIYSDDEHLNIAIKDFIDHRKKMKKPMTDKAIELFIKKLNELAPQNIPEQIRLIEIAIEKGWMSVYPSKEPIQKTAAFAEPEKHEDSPLKIQFLEDEYFKQFGR